jgi:hypothetical protein
MAHVEGDTLYMWVVYDHPSDFPNHFVARHFQATGYDIDREDGPPPTGEYIKATSLEQLRKSLKELMPDAVCLDRKDGDQPLVIETWGFELVEAKHG